MSDKKDTIMTRKAYREQKNREKFQNRNSKEPSASQSKPIPEFHFKNREKEYEPNKRRFYTRELKLDQREIQAYLEKMAAENSDPEEAPKKSAQETHLQTESNVERDQQSKDRPTDQRRHSQDNPSKQDDSSWREYFGANKMAQFLNIGIGVLILGIIILTVIAFFF
ncbi:hypothetical protein [Aerococcus kribbianus]|uniref:Uncharacterized protein n=1 Tax=Aerococcus kribbianus TaxID=2999064 RepID=A0A9X3JG51_9LACT|nr:MULTISPECIES: hypothetical protein [unclassified Aerococcus]MCZ0717697.1 hypothetical protein [Aerococcus sp. YH-aer221]MCZ0725985.1 hypothetical protein [Aerococcus sp. YH-aer222]